MISLTIETDVIATIEKIKAQTSQIPFATSLALNDVAFKARAAEQMEMQRVLDRPKPFTLGGIWAQKSTKQNLESRIGLERTQGNSAGTDRYLMAEIISGRRAEKRFERALITAGVMPAGYVAVPGRDADMDAFGNQTAGQITQILSYFRAFPEDGYRANATAKSRARLAKGTKRRPGFVMFVPDRSSKLPLGVWQRFSFTFGSAIKCLMLFVPEASYRAVYGFQRVGQEIFEREFPRAYDEAMATAMATAK